MIRLDPTRRLEGWAACLRAYGLLAPIPPGWDVFAVVDGDEVVGGVMVKGPEAHIGMSRTGHIRAVFRAVIGEQLKRYGYATTSVRKENKAGQRFVQRIGYVQSGEDGRLIHYVLKELRYA